MLGPGDIVEVDPGTYTDVCQLKASGTAEQPIILRGLPGQMPVFDASSDDVSGAGPTPRAIFQFTGGSYWQVSHLELKNAHNATLNGAAFRVTAGSHDIVIRDVSVHDCQNGMMSDGVATVTVESSEIFHNGAGDGRSHNFYMQGERTTLIGNHIHDSNTGGQNVKLRSRYAELLYNRIENAGNYEIDVIQGPLTSNANANAVLIGNVISRPASSDNNSQVILFGTDNGTETARNGSLYVLNNTFILKNASNRLFHAIAPVAGSQIVFENNIVFSAADRTGLVADPITEGILSGSHNWIGSNVMAAGSLTATLTGDAPGFVSAEDFHLGATSPAVDQGLGTPTFKDGAGTVQSGVPAQEFSAPTGVTHRAVVGSLDMGAFEFGDAGEGPVADSGSGNPTPDAGDADAGQAVDGGALGDGGRSIFGTCGCSEGVNPVGVAGVAACALALTWMRRRKT